MNPAIDRIARPPPMPLQTNGLVEHGADGTLQAFLRPGDWLFGGGPVTVRTLLGSCVSVVLWSPAHRMGGLCHGLLPRRRVPPGSGLDGRFLEEATAWLEAQLASQGIGGDALRASVFGGDGAGPASIGAGNVAWARAWLQQRRLPVEQMDVGGRVLRRLTMTLDAGVVNVAHGGPWAALEEQPWARRAAPDRSSRRSPRVVP